MIMVMISQDEDSLAGLLADFFRSKGILSMKADSIIPGADNTMLDSTGKYVIISTGIHCNGVLEAASYGSKSFAAVVCINPVFDPGLKKKMSGISVPVLFISGNDDASPECISATNYHDLTSGSKHARIKCRSSEISGRMEQVFDAILKFLGD